MDAEKRKLILSEIEHWRRSRLLPEQYCDFLRNLYLAGEEEPASGRWRTFRNLKAAWKPAYGWLLACLITVFLIFSFYFTFFQSVMQTLLSVVVIGWLIGYGIRKRKGNPPIGYAAIGGGNLLVLLFGLAILRQSGLASPQATVALVAGCSLLWLGFGLLARFALLQLSGYIALLLSYLWLVQYWHANPGFWILQLYLVPVCLGLYAAGNWIYGGIGSAGGMMMFSAGFALALPELYGLLFAGMNPLTAAVSLIVKGVLAGYAVWRRRTSDRETDWAGDFDT